MKPFVPAEPFHPGEYVEDELNARGWTHADLAAITGISRRQIVNLIQGKAGVTPETAVALEAAFGEGNDAMGWMNLQAAYELALVAQEGRESKRLAKIYERFPVREIQRRGWIKDSENPTKLESSICRLSRLESISDESSEFKVAARKSSSYQCDTGAQLAWYGRCYQLAESAPCANYSASNIPGGIAELRKLAAYPEDARSVPRVLADMGVRLVFTKHLRKTKIDGAAFWLDETSPVIAMSLRFDRIDYFWFTLLHELCHIKNNDCAPIDVDDLSGKSDAELPEIERIANRQAANYLVPEDKLLGFIRRVKPLYYETKIVQFAQARGVHPGIVVGQLAKHPESNFGYKQLRKLLAKVRTNLLGVAITDGWGNEPQIE